MALALLREFCTLEGHQFWPDELSIRDLLMESTAITRSQVTDIYLLGLAVYHGGKLATLDKRIPTAAVTRGEEVMELLTL